MIEFYAQIRLVHIAAVVASGSLFLLPSAVYANGWLAAKLALLPAYVAHGGLALRRPHPAARQRAYLGAALVAYLGMFTIARTHDPLGPLRLLTDT
jgi:uncharacterized membrane protein SirB2